MKFLSFTEKDVDSFLMMQYTDLARSLSKNSKVNVEYNFLSYYEPTESTLYISRFWDPYLKEQKFLGIKSDIYTRALGYMQETDYVQIQQYMELTRSFPLPHFAHQLLALSEELRMYDLCIRKRPGMHKAIQFRKKAYQTHYSEQLGRHIERKQWADALICALYVGLTQEQAYSLFDFHDELEQLYQGLIAELMLTYESTSSAEMTQLCLKQWPKLEATLPADSHVNYFMIASKRMLEQPEVTDRFDQMTRKNELKNDDTFEKESSPSEDAHEDKLPSWHRETSKPTQSFLQFELESGTKINLLGATARKTDSGDQALGTVQGASQKSKQKDYAEQELEQMKQSDNGSASQGQSRDLPYGEANKYAVLEVHKARRADQEEMLIYNQWKQSILPWQRSLQQTINKTLEHKQTAPREGVHVGRLSNKLLRIWTDDQPRIFYKKQQPSKLIDACFALLVDCSSSMVNKMEQTKKGIVLFHEALAALELPHSIHGFWEDSNRSTSTLQPNVLHEIISFEESLQPTSGAKITQLAPEEDNRDGFIIRHMTERLKHRSEKQKILLVFSDGEPAADDYDDSGIVDTYQAVIEARKHGFTVIGVYLSTEQIQEQEQKAMKNIYGKHHVLVNDVEQLPEYIAPLLKQLILKQVQ